jgi:signal transduction histidine kinase
VVNFLHTGQPKVVEMAREVEGRRKDGSVLPIELDFCEFRLNERCYLTATIRERTTRKQLEPERAELLAREQAVRDQAEAAIRARNRFLTIAAHDLKAPAANIVGFIYLLQESVAEDGRLKEVDRQILETIGRESKRLARLISQLLDISILEGGPLRIQRVPVDLRALTARVVEEVSATLRLYKLESISTTPPLMIEGDEARLEQVLHNLLQNAVKYSPYGGSIQVSVDSRDNMARLAVTDHGIGILPADLPHLFELYYRAPSADALGIGGLGVGLYLVREIVRLHGGEISVQSTPGAGSTFTISLPLLRASQGNMGT